MSDPSGTNPGPRLPVRLGLVLTMAFWGSAFAASKMIVFEVPPDVGAGLRFGLGAILMMGVLFRRSARCPPPRGTEAHVPFDNGPRFGIVNPNGNGGARRKDSGRETPWRS